MTRHDSRHPSFIGHIVITRLDVIFDDVQVQPQYVRHLGPGLRIKSRPERTTIVRSIALNTFLYPMFSTSTVIIPSFALDYNRHRVSFTDEDVEELASSPDKHRFKTSIQVRGQSRHLPTLLKSSSVVHKSTAGNTTGRINYASFSKRPLLPIRRWKHITCPKRSCT